MAINFEQSLLLLDNVKLNVGTGSDLQIYHDGSNSYIEDTGTGSLVVQSSDLFLRTNSTENAVVCAANAGVTLYYDNTAKLATTNTGVSVTGGVSTSSSSDMAGINMTSDLALGSNDLTDSNSQSGTAGQLLSSLGSGNGTDWVNAPVDGVTSVATSAPITGGTITGTGTIGITQADATTNGYLSSTDWSTFNSKGSGTVTGTGVNNRLAIWNGTTAIDSDSDFYVDGDTIFSTNIDATGTVNGATAITGGSLDINGIANISSTLTLEGTTDQILILKSTDDGAIYQSYFRGTDRHAYLGFGGSSDRFDIVNEESGGSIELGTNSITALTLDSSQNATFAGTVSATVNADDATYTGIVTVDGGTFKYRTKAEILSDIGAGTGSGTVTSIGITETGTALTITNTPITGSGNINIAGAGTSSQVILGDLSLATLPVSGVTSIATTSPITGGTITSSGTIAFDDTAVTSLANLATTGTVTTGTWNSNRKISKTSSSDFDYQGDIVYWHTTTVTGGKVYVYQEDQWTAADADAESTSSGTLAIALGNGASNSVGMLIRGTYTLNYDPGTDGELIYIATSAGNLTNEAPSASGDVVRIVGQILDSSNGQIFFNPDYTFITLS